MTERIVQSRTSKEDRHPVAMNHAIRQTHSIWVADGRSEAIAQRKVMDVIHQSPQVQFQQGLRTMIDNSPQMVLKRKQRESMFGETTQRKGASEEEDLLQGKFPSNGTSIQLSGYPIQQKCAECEREETIQSLGKVKSVHQRKPVAQRNVSPGQVVQRSCYVWLGSDCTGKGRRRVSSLHNAKNKGYRSWSYDSDGNSCSKIDLSVKDHC